MEWFNKLSPSQKSASHRKRKLSIYYNLTPNDYDRMVSDQNGVCAICGEAPDRLFVDHNHSSGKVRGLLCHHCNSGIGLLKDDPALMIKAASYVERYKSS
jgi:hypothetical protein